MKVILFAAMSLDGLLADKSGNEDFLLDENWNIFGELVAECGCLVVGRRAYEAVRQWPDYNFDDIQAGLKIVVSGDQDIKLDPPFLAASSPEDAINKAMAGNFKSMVVAGGGTINAAFMSENLIDEVVVNINPVLIGSGTPLFFGKDFERRLSLVEVVKKVDDIVQIKYQVNK